MKTVSEFRAWPPVRLLTIVLLCGLMGLGQSAAQNASSGDSTDAPSPTRNVERPGRTGLPVPRFVSLKNERVNLRRGPGMRYPIDWVYRRRNLPVEVIDEFEFWRQIRDHEGTTGWVHQGLIKGERHLLVVGENRILRRDPSDESRPLALLEQGVLVRMDGCDGDWCRAEIQSLAGWLRRGDVFGVYTDE